MFLEIPKLHRMDSDKMSRIDELNKIFEGANENVKTIVSPMLDELVFIEEQLKELRTKPFIKYHPNDSTQQKQTPAGKLYRDLLAQEKDIVRILCSQIHKGSDDTGESPLREWVKRMGKE